MRTASFDHSCPEENITVLGDNGDRMSRTVSLDVCGQCRVYRDLGGSEVYAFVDITDKSTACNAYNASPPPIPSSGAADELPPPAAD